MDDFLEFDFCRQRGLRINRRFNVDGIPSADLASGTSLGCRFPISHRQNGPGPILSRMDKSTGEAESLFSSPNEILNENPGPSAWLSGCPTKALSGNVSLPFPVGEPQITPRLFWQGDLVLFPGQVVGLGDIVGFRRVVLLPPGDKEYLDPGALANHRARYYAACVSSPNACESYLLVYRNVFVPGVGITQRYLFQGVPGQGTNVTQNVGNWQHMIGVSIVGTAPALLAHEPLTLTPPVDVDTGLLPSTQGTNGPEQTDRKFSYQFVGNRTNPDFGAIVTEDFPLANARPTYTLFAQSEFVDNFGGFETFNVNGQAMSFTDCTLPPGIFANRPFIGISDPPPSNFFDSGIFQIQASPPVFGQLHGQPNTAAQIDIPVDADGEVTFEIRTADAALVDGPVLNFTIEIPKGEGEVHWFEGIVSVWSRHTGSL